MRCTAVVWSVRPAQAFLRAPLLFSSLLRLFLCVVPEDKSRVLVAICFSAIALVQTTCWGGPSFNPCSPAHRLVYYVLGLERPTPPPPPPPSITEPVVLSSSAGRDREGERSSSRRRQGGVRSGSSSPAPARRIPTGGGAGDGNGSGWAGLGGWGVKEALIWTAAALVMIALGRWGALRVRVG